MPHAAGVRILTSTLVQFILDNSPCLKVTHEENISPFSFWKIQLGFDHPGNYIQTE
mgnify:CR=1 FL=1